MRAERLRPTTNWAWWRSWRATCPAREWYLKSLEIKERRGNEAGAALSYAQLGTLERAAGDGPAAKQWFEKALRIFEKRRDNVNIANVKKDLASLADE